MNPLAPLTAALAAALPAELAAYADELAALLHLRPEDLAARLAARPVLAAALVSLVGQPLEVDGQPLQIITGAVGTLQQVTITGGFVERIIGQLITIQLPPAPRVIDPAAAQELLAALPLATLAPVAPLPELHRMPFARNPHFVGRTADMLALARALKGEGGTAALGSAAATTGLGGIGKTNLATEFAHRYGQFFAGGVFWLSFADPANIPLEVAACGMALDLPSFADLALDDQVQRVLSVWAQPMPRLLIFDNCDETEPGRAEALIQQWRPTTGGCRVLITSRRGVWSTSLGVTTLPLGVLSRTESIALLRKHRPELAVDDPALAAIAAELGDLPLALHLAGSYLETYADSPAFGDPATFLSELRAARLLDHEALQGIDSTPSPTNHALHVARTFALSYERLLADDPTDAQALRLLARTAHLAPGNRVPRDLALATLGLAAEDRLGQRHAERGLRELLSLGLIERDGSDALRMHRLVGAYVRQVSDDRDAQADVERVVIREAENLVDAPTLPPLTAFLPVLRGVTDAALGREDEQAAVLCGRLVRHLDRLGSYALAQPYATRALDINERVVGGEHPESAISLSNLASLLRATGNYADARPILERALAIFETALGTAHPATAYSLNNLAELFRATGDYDAAQSLYTRALAINESVLGPDHPQTAHSLNNLALLLEHQGDYAAARLILERALAITERVLGPDHPDTALSLNNLALLLERQGDYAAARPLYARALAITEHVLGPDHPDTATSLSNLASLLHSQGDYAAAYPLYARALAITEHVLGPDHPQTALSLNNLASLLDSQGDYAAAYPLYARALAIREHMLGPDHPDTALSLNNLAVNYAYQDNFQTAEHLMRRALEINEACLGPDHPNTQQSRQSLAAIREHLR
ncbi:tetratricopeptide repeat protein [Candidatus Chloroploca sp. Khr17]|uniref:tetratricopeptide repeat protein n=1 Tax=Candidatus Chloroploca sp. Khr17 TaxID=2496869 RepID=UPI00101DA12D|nr:tetratricopeptide repeat protein [Candidatus Chloroploca sp. Khr17]